MNKLVFSQLNTGLSCVENYVLALHKARCMSPVCLYYQSGISFQKVIRCFASGDLYASFSGVDRLHTLAKHFGMISFDFMTDMPDITELKDPYILWCVAPEFVSERFHSSMWRDDHFIMLANTDTPETYQYWNDIPAAEGTITLQELCDAYHNKCIAVSLHPEVCVSKDEIIAKYIEATDLEDISPRMIADLSPLQLRDAIGVMKVLRNRLLAFYCEYCECDLLDPLSSAFKKHISNLERLYVLVEYARAKAPVLNQDLLARVESLAQKDMEMVQMLTQEIIRKTNV